MWSGKVKKTAKERKTKKQNKKIWRRLEEWIPEIFRLVKMPFVTI